MEIFTVKQWCIITISISYFLLIALFLIYLVCFVTVTILSNLPIPSPDFLQGQPCLILEDLLSGGSFLLG